jgi:hypothetical protein
LVLSAEGYGAPVRRTLAPALAVSIVLLPGCSSDPVGDGDAVASCRDRVPADERAGLRATVTDNGPQEWLVKLWTDTPKDAGGPVGAPNIVCTASARDGSLVIDAFARTRQDRDVSPKALCNELLPALDIVSSDMTSGRDAGPDLVLVSRTLPEPLPEHPDQLARALQELVAEVTPAARASEAGNTGINAGDFFDWPGLVGGVRRACEALS